LFLNGTKKPDASDYVERKTGIRTGDPDLGKVMLYQLSYFRIFGFFNLEPQDGLEPPTY
jgi:hypothetical protein